jgi:hypothetical protein
MVRKFLTREQTYSQLLMAVSDSERKIDKLKKDNEELRGRLHELQIDDNSNTNGNDTTTAFQDEDIVEKQTTLDNLQHDFLIVQEKFKKINIVQDQVNNWAKKAYVKFGHLSQNQLLRGGDNDDIVKIF